MKKLIGVLALYLMPITLSGAILKVKNQKNKPVKAEVLWNNKWHGKQIDAGKNVTFNSWAHPIKGIKWDGKATELNIPRLKVNAVYVIMDEKAEAPKVTADQFKLAEPMSIIRRVPSVQIIDKPEKREEFTPFEGEEAEEFKKMAQEQAEEQRKKQAAKKAQEMEKQGDPFGGEEAEKFKEFLSEQAKEREEDKMMKEALEEETGPFEGDQAEEFKEFLKN